MGVCSSLNLIDIGTQTVEREREREREKEKSPTPTVTALNPDDKAILEKRDYRNLKVHTNENRISFAKVVSVYDGDTVQIVIINRGVEERYKFRMYGYDTPEMKPSKSNALRDLEKQAALVAKEYLAKTILDKVVVVKFNKEEKYGRQMGEIFLLDREPSTTDISVNAMMVNVGLAKPYFGKTKQHWTEGELRRIITL